MDTEQRIYTADEARALRDAATPGPWRTRPGHTYGIGQTIVVESDPVDLDVSIVVDEDQPDAALLAAAPDLAASVEHHAARADAAERERDALRVRVAELTAALRFCARECARCSRPGVWITFNGIVWCDEHKECGVVHHREPQPIEHADVLRSLGARDGAT